MTSKPGTTPNPESFDDVSKPLRVLNLYAGIGGNRKLWENVEVMAVESEQYIADAYKQLFPDDTVVVGDAHQYLLDHHKEFDFIWASPPRPTHSKLSMGLAGWGILRYPDMTLYQEIIFLKHFYKGKWLVENVEPYYGALIMPSVILDRHFFWANFHIPIVKGYRDYTGEISNATVEQLTEGLGIVLPDGTKNKRKLLRNAVDPRIGLHILQASLKVRGITEPMEFRSLVGTDAINPPSNQSKGGRNE